MRRSSRFLWFTAVEALILGLFAVHGAVQSRASLPALGRQRQVVSRLQLTDLALFTEARYTRHPSQADVSSAFQEHPLSLEHFPTGSLVPASLAGPGGNRAGP